MVHRIQDTYPLTHFRQHTSEHLERIAEGRIETITQNGEAALVVMSPETYDAMRIEIERGQLWDRAIAGVGEGRGRDAMDSGFRLEACERVDELGLITPHPRAGDDLPSIG